jgi:hypothetical protein
MLSERFQRGGHGHTGAVVAPHRINRNRDRPGDRQGNGKAWDSAAERRHRQSYSVSDLSRVVMTFLPR